MAVIAKRCFLSDNVRTVYLVLLHGRAKCGASAREGYNMGASVGEGAIWGLQQGRAQQVHLVTVFPCVGVSRIVFT